MKTSIDFIGDESCPKLTNLKVTQISENQSKTSTLGECMIDLSKFVDWVDKRKEKVELSNGKGKVEFDIKS